LCQQSLPIKSARALAPRVPYTRAETAARAVVGRGKANGNLEALDCSTLIMECCGLILHRAQRRVAAVTQTVDDGPMTVAAVTSRGSAVIPMSGRNSRIPGGFA
jgi:hypothetical protein